MSGIDCTTQMLNQQFQARDCRRTRLFLKPPFFFASVRERASSREGSLAARSAPAAARSCSQPGPAATASQPTAAHTPSRLGSLLAPPPLRPTPSTPVNSPQEPFLAIIIDPVRTCAAGRVEIGAFRTFPEGYTPSGEGQSEYQTIPLNKIEDFGVHANQYYTCAQTHRTGRSDPSALLFAGRSALAGVNCVLARWL